MSGCGWRVDGVWMANRDRTLLKRITIGVYRGLSSLVAGGLELEPRNHGVLGQAIG